MDVQLWHEFAPYLALARPVLYLKVSPVAQEVYLTAWLHAGHFATLILFAFGHSQIAYIVEDVEKTCLPQRSRWQAQ